MWATRPNSEFNMRSLILTPFREKGAEGWGSWSAASYTKFFLKRPAQFSFFRLIQWAANSGSHTSEQSPVVLCRNPSPSLERGGK